MDNNNFDELLKFCKKALLFLDKKHKEVCSVYGDVPKAKTHVLFSEITDALMKKDVDIEQVAALWVLITVEQIKIAGKMKQKIKSPAKSINFQIGDFSAN